MFYFVYKYSETLQISFNFVLKLLLSATMERLLHYVWKNRLMPREGLTTTDGQKIEILSVGIHNRDAGPGFFGADVIIGDEDWMGNVEIHTRSSDWYRHGHDKDEAYNNVVLHVAETVDADVVTATGRKVPQLVLSVPEYVVEKLSATSGGRGLSSLLWHSGRFAAVDNQELA